MALPEEKHVRRPGSSFNVDYNDHFRPRPAPTIHTVFQRIESLLAETA
jgi:hypothetical protein